MTDEKPFTIIGHRGAAGLAPENTLASFEAAIACGCTAVELDVHCAASGELVVIHDERLERTTDGTGWVHRHRLADLQALLIDGVHRIPTLAQVVDILVALNAQPFLLNIELKGKRTGMATAEFLRSASPKLSYLVSSFDHDELLKFASATDTVAATAPLFDRWDPAWKEVARAVNAKAVNISKTLATPKRVAMLNAAGYLVYVYTVNSIERGARLKAMGVDGIFTDRPDRFLDPPP